MRELERRVLLTVLDRKWREHLYEMDYLREGIGLRAMAQRDPLVEYQREGGDMFNAMMEAFMEEVVGFVFHLEVEVNQAPQVGVVTRADGAPMHIAAGRNGNGRAGRRQAAGRVRADPDGPGWRSTSSTRTSARTSSRRSSPSCRRRRGPRSGPRA